MSTQELRGQYDKACDRLVDLRDEKRDIATDDKRDRIQTDHGDFHNIRWIVAEQNEQERYIAKNLDTDH